MSQEENQAQEEMNAYQYHVVKTWLNTPVCHWNIPRLPRFYQQFPAGYLNSRKFQIDDLFYKLARRSRKHKKYGQIITKDLKYWFTEFCYNNS